MARLPGALCHQSIKLKSRSAQFIARHRHFPQRFEDRVVEGHC